MAIIKVEKMILVEVDEYICDNSMRRIRQCTGRKDGMVHVDIADYDDLAECCKSNRRLSRVLEVVRDRALMEGVESILFW